MADLWILDLDRTLTNNDYADEMLIQAAASKQIDTAGLRQAKAELESSGGSFDILVYLEQQGVPADMVQAICEQFIAQAQADQQLLYDDAAGLLSRLAAADIPMFIMTYGTRDWQLTKLRAAGLDHHPWVIVPEKRKSQAITDWRTADGQYALTTDNGFNLTGERVVLVDDKAVSFHGLPADCIGYCLRRPDVLLLPSQAGELAPQVHICASLRELLPI